MRWLALVAAATFVLAGFAQSHGTTQRPTPLPDLDQAPPFGVALRTQGRERLLVFGSAVDNVGRGPLVVEARRTGNAMIAWQVVGDHSYPLQTPLRYVHAETHQHWHLLGFERYELLRGGVLAGGDRKTGFCLNDAYETRPLNRTPRWTGQCGFRRPNAHAIREGISPGFGDDYVPEKEGQSIDVTGLPAGRYVLVHRVNPDHMLRERSYANNGASVLIELRGQRVRVLARCPGSATCGTS